MPRIVFSPNAGRNLVRLRQFIAEHNKEAAARAARLILDAANNLKTHPLLGRPVEEMPEYHDLVIPFGSAGYIMRYRIDGEIIFIVGIRHGKEEKLGQL
jgi:plasmid stabilization system protein ParE